MMKRRKTRVAFLVPHQGMSGAEGNIAALLRNLPKDEFTLYVVAPLAQPLLKIAEQCGFSPCAMYFPRFMSTSIEVGRRRIPNPFAILYDLTVIIFNAFRLARFTVRNQIDVVYSGAMLTHLMASILKLLYPRTFLVVHVQEIASRNFAFGLGPRILRLFLSRADRIVAISQAVAISLGKIPRIIVVPNGVRLEDFQNSDANAFRREFSIAETQIIVGIVGRLTPWKGHKLFLAAAAQLIKDGYDALFVIVGDDVDPVTGLSHYRANLEQYTTQLGLTNQVLFTGHRPDIPNVMRGLDILVVPSIRPEPFGLVAIEAMACSKPVIAAAHGGLSEIVIDHSTGLTFIPGDVHSLTAAIRFLLEHRDLRGEYGHEGQYRVSKNFTLEYYVASMGRLFHI